MAAVHRRIPGVVAGAGLAVLLAGCGQAGPGAAAGGGAGGAGDAGGAVTGRPAGTAAEQAVTDRVRARLPGHRLVLLRTAPDGAGGTDRWYFDHTDLVLRQVDATGRPAPGPARPGVFPAAAPAEEAEAAALLFGSPVAGPLRAAAAALDGGPGPDRDHLVRGLPVTPAQVPAAGPAGGFGDCARHRCLRVVVRSPGGHWLDTRRTVVDLTARRVLRIEPAAGR